MINRKDYPFIPIEHPHPDARGFIRALMGQEKAARPLMVEYLVDDVVREPIVTGLLGRRWVPSPAGDQAAAYWDTYIDFWYRMGYDFVRYEEALAFPKNILLAKDTADAASGDRRWTDEHHGTITSWADFEAYPWPKVEEFDFRHFEYLNSHLPEGMGLIVAHCAGMYEHLSQLFSYEGLCYALFDQPDLVAAVCKELGERMERFYEHIAGLDHVVAIFPGDDMGFRSATLVAPDDLRKYILPWHKRFAAVAHRHNLPYFLHSCGKVTAIIDDLIDDVRLDGKHSYEDAIIPIAEFQKLYGDRLAVLGGIDIDVLGSRPADEVRATVRRTVDTCAPRGRFAVGSGSSVASYIPLENYLAMLDEAQRPF